MDTQSLLLKTFTLAHRVTMVNGGLSDSEELIRNTVASIRTDGMVVSMANDRNQTAAIKDLMMDVIDGKESLNNTGGLVQRIQLVCGDDVNLANAFKSVLPTDTPDETRLAEYKKEIVQLRKELLGHFRDIEVKSAVEATYRLIAYGSNMTSKQLMTNVTKMMDKLSGLVSAATDTDTAIIGELDLGSEKDMSKVFGTVRGDAKGTTLIKTRWQGLNRMLGGGFRDDQCVGINALQHNNKSGILRGCFVSHIELNPPVMLDPTKKPMVLYVTLEDTIKEALAGIYSVITEKPVSESELKDMDETEMANEVTRLLSVNGYTSRIVHADPSKWSYQGLISLVLKYEAMGYEIKGLYVDYLTLLPTTGCRVGSMGDDVRDLIVRIKNFTKPRHILLVSPYQLSPEAGRLRRLEDDRSFVQQLPGKNYYFKCSTIGQELDTEIFICITKHGYDVYQEFQRGKNRGVNGTPVKYHYYVQKFPDDGSPLKRDMDGKDLSLMKVGAAGPNTADDGFSFL